MKAIGTTAIAGGAITGTALADNARQVDWANNGSEHVEACHVGPAEIHWVLTTGGSNIEPTPTIDVRVGGTPVVDGKEMYNPGRGNNNGAWHVNTDHEPGVTADNLSATAYFEGGTDNSRLVISGVECAYLMGFQIDLFRDDGRGAIETTFGDGEGTSYNAQDSRLVRSWWSTSEGGYQEDYDGTYTEPFDLGAIGFNLENNVATVTLDLRGVDEGDRVDYGLASYDADGHSWGATNGFDRQTLYDYDGSPDEDDGVFTFTVNVPVGPGYPS